MNLEDDFLKISGEEVPLQRSRPAGKVQACFRAILEETVDLPPHAESIIPARTEGLSHIDEKWGILEPTVEKSYASDGLMIGKTLVNLQEPSVPVRVMNLSDSPKRIKKGSVIAVGDTVQSVLVLQSCHNERIEDLDGEVPEHLRELYQRSILKLNPNQQQQVRTLLCEFSDLFSRGQHDLGRTDVIQHQINTGDATPLRQPPRRMPLARRREAQQAVEEMHKAGVIEPSSSPWASPVVLVRKKDGTTRFCVDYRKLNHVTKKDSYPLPRIDDTLEALAGARWFSSLDLKSGYWQVQLHPDDKEKTAFSAGRGLWQFKVMPFGLCNAPATFERLMEQILTGLPLAVCLVYLDDILVPGRTFEQQIGNLRTVFMRLKEAKLKLAPKKCSLFREEVKFLGHIVSASGVATDPDKLYAVSTWPRPTNVLEVRQFLGLCSYYRRFVAKFADIAQPLYQCTERNQPFEWTEGAEHAFNRLKQALTEAPILGYPEPTGNYILDADASAFGIGAVLSQVQKGEEKVIAYFSRQLSRQERQYCATRRELLAIIQATKHFHHYLYGREFTVRTDHAALKWLLNFKNPEGQTARWLEHLQQYNFTIEHRQGEKHGNANALSRRPCLPDACKHCSKQEAKEIQMDSEACRVSRVSPFWSNKDLQGAQMADADMAPIAKWLLKSEHKPAWPTVASHSASTKMYWAQWSSLRLRDGVVYRLWETPAGDSVTWQLLLPKTLRSEALYQLHNTSTSGHLGISKTLGRVRERYYWIGCRQDVQRWCRNCDTCASRNGPQKKRKAPMAQYNVGSPMERIAADVLGPLPTSDSGNKYLLIVADYFTKWTEAFPLQHQEATKVAEVIVKEVVSRFGVPLSLHSDQGRNFESAVFSEMCSLLGIEKTRTTPLHPQSDGMVERFNRTLEAQLSKFVSDHHRDWDQHVPLLMMAYRTAVHETSGNTPAKLMLGRDLRLPVDLLTGRPNDEPLSEVTDYAIDLQEKLERVHNFARENLKLRSDKMKEYYDASSQEETLHEGDPVWLYNPTRKKGLSPKLMRPWQGPYIIVKKINDLVYRIQLGVKCKPKVVHKNRLWKYTGNNVPSWNIRGASDRKAKASEMNIDAVEVPKASQSRPPFTDKSTSNQTVEQNQAMKRNQAKDDVSQQHLNKGLRRSSRPRQAPARYGQ